MRMHLYCNWIISKLVNMTGQYLEFESEERKKMKYKVMPTEVFIRPESVVYPYVEHVMKNKICTISTNQYAEILVFVDNSGMKSI